MGGLDGIDTTDVHSPLCADSGGECRAGEPATQSPPVSVHAPFRTPSGKLPVVRNTPPSAVSTTVTRSRSPKHSESRRDGPKANLAAHESGNASTRAGRDLRRAAASQNAQTPAPPCVYGAQKPRPI